VAGRTIALVRIATAILFLLFGEYKLANGEFAHQGFPQYLKDFIATSALRWYVPFLTVVQAHAPVFGYLVGVVESVIGISLLLGWQVRAASVLGALFMLNMIACTWWDPGHSAPVWRYFGAELDHIPLLLLFTIFFAANAGTTWGLDGRRV
jgi:uncharacterized membrane protein YphA (DoxX/SURF4 family)